MPSPLDEVTRLLRDAATAQDSANELPAERDAAIRTLADALTRRRRIQARRRWLPALAAAIVVLGIGGAFAASRAHRSTIPVATGVTEPARDLGRLVAPSGEEGATMAEGSELRTNDASEASLHFATGTQVTVAGGSRVRLVEQTKTKRFSLDQGSVAARVAKLGAGERFIVATSDAEIEVRGTVFRVSITTPDSACGDGTPTRLDVSEGVVVVRHAGIESSVPAGGHWPSCAAPIAVTALPAASSGAAFVAPASRPRPAPTTAASSHLAEQNDMFDEAMRRKRNGDTNGAVAQLDRLLATYPSGPLAESAAAERRRLLSSAPR